MQKHNFILLFSFICFICFSYVEIASAAIISLPRYQGSNPGGRKPTPVTCASKGGVEKGANQTCSGPFFVGGKTCYKECNCNTSVYKYTDAAHKGNGKLCASLSNACIIDDVTKYSICKLNTCNKQNSEWIGGNNKTTYTSKNYQCTEQSSSGSDGVCNKCACPAAWATGSCPTTGVKSCKECPKTDPYTVAKFNLESCEGGYYKNGNACALCPAGYKCDGINKTQCPGGSYAAAGASTCSQCPAGQYSPAGASSCSSCAAGTYATAGSISCSKCSAGTYSAAGASSCISCSAGKYSAAGASYCNTCAAGTYATTGASSCTSCKAGTYSSVGASSCSTCKAGTYSSVGASSCSTCKAGSYSSAGAASCSTCPSGQKVNDDQSGCVSSTCAAYSVAPWVEAPDTTVFAQNCKLLDSTERYYGYAAQWYSSEAKQVCEGTTYVKCIDCEAYVGAPGATVKTCANGYVKVKADGTVSRGMGYETLNCGLCSNDCAKAFSAATFVTCSRSDPGACADNCQTKGMGYFPSEFYDCGGATYAPCQTCSGINWVTRGWYVSSTTDLSDSEWSSQCSIKYGYGAEKDEKISCGYKRYYSCKCGSGYTQTASGCEPNIGNCSKSSTCSTLSFNNGYVSFTNTWISDFVQGAETTCRGIYKNGSYAGSCIYCEKDHRIYAKCNNSGIQDGFCTNTSDCNATP